MKKTLLTVILLVCCFVIQGGNNQKSETLGEQCPPEKIDWAKKSRAGSGVICYTNKQGNPTEIYVIGVGHISSKLPAVYAEKMAKRAAENNAKASFLLWQKENLTVKTENDEKMLVLSKDGVESSTVDVKQSTHTTQSASGVIQGMSPYWYKIDPERKSFTMVWRWKATHNNVARMIKMLSK